MAAEHFEARGAKIEPVRYFRWRPWLLISIAMVLVGGVSAVGSAYRDVLDVGEIARRVDWLVVGVLGLVAATSFLSGIFGMVGGMILIGALVLLLDMTTAMLLITAVLLATNVWRLAAWSRHAAWKVVGVVTLGGLIAFAALRYTGFMPTKGWVLVILGAPPLLINIIPASLWPSIDRLVGQVGCGLVAGLAQVMGGSGAAITEIFFQKSRLSRVEMVATKAGLNVPLQLLRGAYFGLATYTASGTIECSLPMWVFGAAIAVGIAATTAGGYVLKHWFSDRGFLAWNWRFSNVSSVFFVTQGVWLLTI